MSHSTVQDTVYPGFRGELIGRNLEVAKATAKYVPYDLVANTGYEDPLPVATWTITIDPNNKDITHKTLPKAEWVDNLAKYSKLFEEAAKPNFKIAKTYVIHGDLDDCEIESLKYTLTLRRSEPIPYSAEWYARNEIAAGIPVRKRINPGDLKGTPGLEHSIWSDKNYVATQQRIKKKALENPTPAVNKPTPTANTSATRKASPGAQKKVSPFAQVFSSAAGKGTTTPKKVTATPNKVTPITQKVATSPKASVTPQKVKPTAQKVATPSKASVTPQKAATSNKKATTPRKRSPPTKKASPTNQKVIPTQKVAAAQIAVPKTRRVRQVIPAHTDPDTIPTYNTTPFLSGSGTTKSDCNSEVAGTTAASLPVVADEKDGTVTSFRKKGKRVSYNVVHIIGGEE
ncbi:hypothetical protein MBLNU230_g1018t1 [Neophaeotheca triangularis]